MSGRKTIVVDEAEWRRLQQQATSLVHVQRDLPKLVRDVREQTRRDLDRSVSRFEARQASVDHALAGLSEQTRRLEADTTRRLQETSRRMREELDRNTTQLRVETHEQIRRQADMLQQELAAERRERQAAIDHLEAGVTALRTESARAATTAAQWLADSRLMVKAIRQLPHDRYAPRALDALSRRLDAAERTASSGQGAFTLGTVQQLFEDLSDLRFDVEQRDLQWRHRRSLAEKALLVVEGTIEQSRFLVSGTDEAGADVQVDVDFWSRGALSELKEDVGNHLAAVRSDDRPLSDDELGRLLERGAPEYSERLERVVDQARSAVLASQLRANLAELIVEALQESHLYCFADSTYEGGDQRGPFFARSAHSNGSEVVVQIEPAADDSTECQVRILSYDTDAESAETRDARAASIRESLQANGVSVRDVTEDPGEPETRFRDLEGLRREVPRKATSSTRRTLHGS